MDDFWFWVVWFGFVSFGLVVLAGAACLVIYRAFKNRDDNSNRKMPPPKVLENLYYVRGILRKRFDGKINDLLAMDLLTDAYFRGMNVEVMMAYARVVESWDVWVDNIGEIDNRRLDRKKWKKKFCSVVPVGIEDITNFSSVNSDD